MLGPHVVGQRIVIRRFLPGETAPSGRPAMTDVLGTCLAWGDGVCVVLPDNPRADTNPEPIRIPIAEIVTGKPVPPRASPRLRISPQEAQLRALALWPDLRTEPLGSWLLRHSNSTTARRANSALALCPPEADDAPELVARRYREIGRRPIAAVLADSTEEELFLSRGWAPESDDADSIFQVAGVASARRSLGGVALPDVEIRRAEGTAQVTVQVIVEGDTVARGVAAVGLAAGEDWVGFRDIEVAPAHRGNRLGLLVLANLLEWAAERGATTAYLHVLSDNHRALQPYGDLGFTEHHRYRYLATA